jgi:hypothetical protein
MQNEKNVICSLFLLVIVSVNAQLKARRISTYYGKQISEYHQVEVSVSFWWSRQILRNKKYGVTNEGRDLNVYFISTLKT